MALDSPSIVWAACLIALIMELFHYREWRKTIRAPSNVVLWIILAAASLTVMAGALVAPALNLIEEGLGVSPNSARLVITTHSLFIALFSPLVGILIDRVGAKILFIIGLFSYGLSGTSGMMVSSYSLLIVSRIALGISVSAIFTSITVMILSLYKGRQIDNVMGWRSSFNNIGGIAWPLLGGFLGTFSWRMPFLAYVIGIPLGIIALVKVPEIHQVTVKAANATGSAESVLNLFKKNPELIITCSLTFLTMFFLYTNMIFAPKIVGRFGMAHSFYIGILLSSLGLAGATISLFYGRIKTILSYKSIVTITTAVWAVGFAIMSLASSIWVVTLAMVLFGFGMGAIMPATVVWTGEVVPAPFRGRITSYLAVCGFLGQFLSSIVLNPIASASGVNTVFIVITGISASLFFASLVLMLESSKS